MGVSRVMGRMAAVKVPSGRPDWAGSKPAKPAQTQAERARAALRNTLRNLGPKTTARLHKKTHDKGVHG